PTSAFRRRRRQAVAATPPSTLKISPWTKLASSLRRKAIAFELSSSVPLRRSGIRAARFSYSSFVLRPIAPGVGTEAGDTALTRIPRGPSSAAITRVNATTAPFTELYADVFGKPRAATGDAR